MTTWRMTIPWLMALVVASAIWSVWLLRPTFHAASFAFTTAMTVLLIALLQLRYGRHRAFWFGFAVFGWGYALLAFGPGSWTQTRPYLLTSHLLGDLAETVSLTKNWTRVLHLGPDYQLMTWDAGLNSWFTTIEGNRFQRVGHSLAAILHGVAGGLLAAFLERGQRRREDTAIADPTGAR